MSNNKHIYLIVAIAENGVIGDSNSLLWHISEDMRHFRALTTGHTIVMGRKTHESLGRALPNRQNIVISRGEVKTEGVVCVHSLDEAFAAASDSEIYIIGGAQVYAQALPLVERMYVTRVFHSYTGDTLFPAFDANEWKKVGCERFEHGEKFEYPFAMEVYERARE